MPERRVSLGASVNDALTRLLEVGLKRQAPPGGRLARVGQDIDGPGGRIDNVIEYAANDQSLDLAARLPEFLRTWAPSEDLVQQRVGLTFEISEAEADRVDLFVAGVSVAPKLFGVDLPTFGSADGIANSPLPPLPFGRLALVYPAHHHLLTAHPKNAHRLFPSSVQRWKCEDHPHGSELYFCQRATRIH